MSKPRSAKKSSTSPSAKVERSPEPGTPAWAGVILPLAIFALAFSIRLIYLFQVETIPLFYHPASDARNYDEWAQKIAAGDWAGQGVFYQAPLYPYFLGLLQFVIGHDLWWVRIVQIVLGAASCVLLYWAGSSLFSRRAGIAAGLILSLYAPAIFFDALLQKTVLDLFWVTLLLFLLGKARQRPRWIRWALIGVVLALLGLTRENALVWLLVIPLWIWFDFAQRERRERTRWIGVLVAGAALVLLPVGLRNLKIGGEFTLTTSQFGPNFFIGNNPLASGSYAPLRPGHGDPKFERQDATELAEQALGRRLSPGEVSSYWLGRSWDYIRSQPLDWLRLMGKKWLLVWNVRELEDADDFYLYQKWSWLLRALSWVSHFGLLAPLAALGVALTWRQWRRLWLLYCLLMTLALSVALFYVFGRYRFPIVPLLALFAGAGLAEGLALYRERKIQGGLICAAAALLSALVVNWPVSGRTGPSATSYNNLGNAFANDGKNDEAIEGFQQALRILSTYELAHYNLGNVLVSKGELDRAKYHLQEAVRLSPDFVEAHNNLGLLLGMQGQYEEAARHFRRVLELGLVRGETYFDLGLALFNAGRVDEAKDSFEEALKIKPDYAEAHHLLGRLKAARGQINEAIEHFRQAVRLEPGSAAVHESLARALAQQGKREEAVQHYQEALRLLKSRSEGHSRR